MNLPDLLRTLERLGIKLNSTEGSIEIDSPSKSLTAEIISSIKDHKSNLLKLIQSGEFEQEVSYWMLTPYLRQEVQTPDGKGLLWQVFRGRVGVVLNSLPGHITFYGTKLVLPSKA